MTESISIKVTRIKPERRSRGRIATSTRTLVRGVRADAHPAQIMRMMSGYFMLLKHMPASYVVKGVRYELLRVESRKVNGVRISRAVFKGEGEIKKSFAREMRRRHRAERKAERRAARLEEGVRAAKIRAMLAYALARAMIARACAARYAASRVIAQGQFGALSPLYLTCIRNYCKSWRSKMIPKRVQAPPAAGSGGAEPPGSFALVP